MKKKVWPIPHNIYNRNSKCILDLNEKAKSIKHLGKKSEEKIIIIQSVFNWRFDCGCIESMNEQIHFREISNMNVHGFCSEDQKKPHNSVQL